MTTTTWSKPTRLFRPLCVNDLQVEAIPNAVQLDNCNTCVTPMIPGAEGGCAPDRTIARTVKVHLPFSLQEKNPSGVTTDRRTWGSRLISVVDGGVSQSEFTATQKWYTSPVPGGTAFSLVIPPYSRPCRRYMPLLTTWYQAFRPMVYSFSDTNTETWIRPPGFIDKANWVPKPPPLQTGQTEEGYVPITNSANLEYMWGLLPYEGVFQATRIPGSGVDTPPIMWPSHPNPPDPRLGHPDFQDVYDLIGLDPSIPYGARPQFNLGVKGWIWTMQVTQVSYPLRHAVYEVNLWSLGYYTIEQTAGSAVHAAHSTTDVFPSRNLTYDWHYSGNHIGTGQNGQTFYSGFPSSVAVRPEGPVAYPPGVVYPAPFGSPVSRIFPRELPQFNPLVSSYLPSPWAAANPSVIGVLGNYGPRYSYTLARVGSWRGAIDYDDPVPAPLIGGFASTGAAAAPVGPVTLPSTIYLDIGPPL